MEDNSLCSAQKYHKFQPKTTRKLVYILYHYAIIRSWHKLSSGWHLLSSSQLPLPKSLYKLSQVQCNQYNTWGI